MWNLDPKNMDFNIQSLHDYIMRYFKNRSKILSFIVDEADNTKGIVTVKGSPDPFTFDFQCFSLTQIQIGNLQPIDVVFSPQMGWLANQPDLSLNYVPMRPTLQLAKLESVLDYVLMHRFELVKHGIHLP